MKYSEFREYLTLNKIPLIEDKEKLIVDSRFEISKTEECSIWFSLSLIEYPHECELLKKVIELAETPLSEREEEKKYYLKHRFINSRIQNYLNQKKLNPERLVLGTLSLGTEWESEFTLEEIEELKEKYDTDLRDFELIEVGD